MIEILPFDPHIVPLMLVLVVLLTISALVSASETAFFSLTPTQLSEIGSDHSRQSVTVIKLLSAQDSLLSALLITNNLVNIGAVFAANSVIDLWLKFIDAPLLAFGVKVFLVTFILLLFSEIMPKIYAAYNNVSVARFMSIPVLGLRTVLRPVSYILTKVGALITSAIAGKGRNVSMDDLQDAIEITKTETPEDKKMLSGIVRFVGTEVDEIMKPRIDVVALDIELPFSEVRKTVVASGLSRLPVYEESFDHVKGILFVKDLIPYLDRDDTFEWQTLLREPFYVPEHKKINDLLEDFQEKKKHMAIVVDEYGGTLGIVSLEDILEEIVGEISDESDIIQTYFQKIDDHNFIFDGKANIGDCERALSLPNDHFDRLKGEADTVAGLMLEIKGDFFKVNDVIEIDGIKFTAEAVDNYRITKVLVTLMQSK